MKVPTLVAISDPFTRVVAVPEIVVSAPSALAITRSLVLADTFTCLLFVESTVAFTKVSPSAVTARSVVFLST